MPAVGGVFADAIPIALTRGIAALGYGDCCVNGICVLV